jgi:hypothetical protein
MARVDLPRLLAAVGAPEIGPDDEVVDLEVVAPGSLEDLPPASVDVVVAPQAFRTLGRAKAQLGCVVEIARVLRIEGWAAFALSTDPVPERQSRRGMFRALAGAEPERAAGFVPLDALGATAVQAGLRLERIEGANTRETLVLAVKEAN